MYQNTRKVKFVSSFIAEKDFVDNGCRYCYTYSVERITDGKEHKEYENHFPGG